MADALLRRLMILQRLPEYPRKTSTRQLLSALQREGIACSIRTVQRDLEYLSSSGLFGIAADTDCKPAGWYWIRGGHGGTFQFMDRSSAVAFALMEPMLIGKLPSSVSAKLDEYFHQSRKFLTNDQGWTRKVYIARGEVLSNRELEDNALDTICEALDQNVCLSMDFGRYYKGIDLNFVHVDMVHPLALITKENTVYLIHYKGSHKRVSLAPVHHLRNLQLLDVPVCEEAESFDINTYVEQSKLHKVFEKDVSYKFKVTIKTARYLKENPLAKGQTVKLLDDGTCDVTFVADDTTHLRSRLRSLELLD